MAVVSEFLLQKFCNTVPDDGMSIVGEYEFY